MGSLDRILECHRLQVFQIDRSMAFANDVDSPKSIGHSMDYSDYVDALIMSIKMRIQNV